MGFAGPGEPVSGALVPEALPAPILPAVSSRMLRRPEYMAAVTKALPDAHPAKRLPTFDRIGPRIGHLRAATGGIQRESQAKLVGAAGFGTAGLAVMASAFLSGSLMASPMIVLASFGMVAGIRGLMRARVEARDQRAQAERSRALETPPENKVLHSGRPVARQCIDASSGSNDHVTANLAVEGLPDISDLPDWLRSTLVAIPATGPEGFMMGDNNSTLSDSDEKPEHKVILGAHYMMNCTVTNAMWRRFSNKSIMWRGPTPSQRGFDDDNQPVVCVSWDDAVEFTGWLTELSGGKVKFRLPTEAEWERAARGRSGKQEYGTKSGGLTPEEANYAQSGFRRTVDVYTYGFNDFGLYQMSGNVWEWCGDWYDADYYAHSPLENPKGPEYDIKRVLRGGSWSNVNPQRLRGAYRDFIHPGYGFRNIGFRVAAAL